VGEHRVFVEGLLDLQRQLPRRLEDEAAHRPVAAQALDDRERERRGLARARLRRADDVAALEDQRDRLDLDRRGLGVALLLDRVGERVAEPERRERGLHLRDVDGDQGLVRPRMRMLEVVAGGTRLSSAAEPALDAPGWAAALRPPLLRAPLLRVPLPRPPVLRAPLVLAALLRVPLPRSALVRAPLLHARAEPLGPPLGRGLAPALRPLPVPAGPLRARLPGPSRRRGALGRDRGRFLRGGGKRLAQPCNELSQHDLLCMKDHGPCIPTGLQSPNLPRGAPDSRLAGCSPAA